MDSSKQLNSKQKQNKQSIDSTLMVSILYFIWLYNFWCGWMNILNELPKITGGVGFLVAVNWIQCELQSVGALARLRFV